MDNKQSTIREMALFAGAGGGILGGHLLGWKTVCTVEWEPYPACVLAARQNDGILPPFPIWDDVQTFDGRPWRGLVDVVSGGFPCQDISAAGKGAGIEGDRSSMWKHMARIIGEVRPQYVLVENSPLLISRGAGLVIADLTEMGYDCQWAIISASDLGAPHQRDRFWLVGIDTNRKHERQERTSAKQQPTPPASGNSSRQGAMYKMADTNLRDGFSLTTVSRKLTEGDGSMHASWPTTQLTGDHSSAKMANASPSGLQGGDIIERMHGKAGGEWAGQFTGSGGGIIREWWATEPDVGRVADGVAARVDRLKAIGNGQVPIVAATGFRILNK